MAKRIIVRITRDGRLSVGAEGVAGPACQQLTNNIEHALGRVERSTPTQEMYDQEQQAWTGN